MVFGMLDVLRDDDSDDEISRWSKWKAGVYGAKVICAVK